MHIVAANPLYLNESSVPREVLDREVSILQEQAASSNKPKAIIDRMVQGRYVIVKFTC